MHYNLARAFASQGKYEQAIAEYRRTVALKPDDADALIGLAWVLVRVDRPDLRNPAVAVRLTTKPFGHVS